MAVSMLVLPASAASLNNSAIQTAITLGAMDTSQTGSLDAAVTRGAFAKMLVSFSAYRESAAQQGNIGTLYKDAPGTSQWAPYVRIAVQQGWMNGYTDGTFRPDAYITRAQAMTMINRVLNRIPEENSDLPAGMNTWPDCNPGDWFYLAIQEATNSHAFQHKAGNYETWTGMNKNPDWTRYEH